MVVPHNIEKPVQEKERLYRKYFNCTHGNKGPFKTHYQEERSAGLGLPPSTQMTTLMLHDIACVDCQKNFNLQKFYDFVFNEEWGPKNEVV